uniref:LEM domain-containing protein n=1 Tax=Anopheles minimus TaxID=112268 RepID=A0A182WIK5_9DIPT
MRASRVPPDGGYGWVVVAGCALVNVFNQSLVSVFGLMFADYLASLGEHAFGAALVMNVCNISLNFSGLITGPIIKQFKPRKAAILGSLLTGSALTFCSYSTKLWQIVLSYSVSFGFGLGLIQSSTFVALNSFFRHRKGRAVGFALAGTGVGQILMPLLVQYLLSNFNFRDTTLIIGGLAFNGLFVSGNRVMGDNFDDMSNDQLRLKLLEFGLANMPVTTTTRKVLIKKLRNHIATNGKRRETINLTKYSSDEDSEPASRQSAAPKKGSSLSKKELTGRRATTIGVVATTKQPKPVSLSQPLPKATQALPSASAAALKRRSGRVTPVKDNNAATSAPSQVVLKVPAILEDSDDDMIPLTQLTQQDRKSASPSLSRAEMLTTSYIHQMAMPAKPLELFEEEMEVDIPEMRKNLEEEDVIVLEDDEDEAIAMASMPPPHQPKPSGMKISYSQTTVQTEIPPHTFTTGTMTDQKDKEQETFTEPTP